jgi:DHA3 family macrolide efflux protein-like MFS transporter
MARDPIPGPGNSVGWRLLKTRDFGFLFAGQAISQVGDGLNRVALLWFVYELTGSALKTTAIGLLQTLPPLVLGPLLGVYLDRWPKKRVMVWVDLIRTFMVAMIPLLYALGALTLERLYVLVFLTAIFSTVFGPALASAVPLIVPRAQLMGANALLQSTANIGVLVGPAVSGVLIAFIGAQNVLLVNAVTFFISALCLLPIRVRAAAPPPAAEAAAGTLARDLRDLMTGFRFVFFQHRTVSVLMVTAALYTLGMSAFAFLLPVVAKKVLLLGPVELGWLWSGLGAGMLASSCWLVWARQGDVRQRFRFVACALAIGGVAVCSLSLLRSASLSAGLMILIGGSTAVFMPAVWAVLQEVTPEHMLGRVFTMFSSGGMASAMAGMTAFGWAADMVSAQASLVGVGVFLLGAACLAAHFSLRFGVKAAPRTVLSPLRVGE